MTHPEETIHTDSGQALSEDPLLTTSSTMNDAVSFPQCRTSCLVSDVLKANGGCKYNTLKIAAEHGKAQVRGVLSRSSQEEFGALLEQGADAPCLTNPQKRALIDRQINAEDHDRRSDVQHATVRKKLAAADARRSQHVPVALHDIPSFLPEKRPRRTFLQKLVAYFG